MLFAVVASAAKGRMMPEVADIYADELDNVEVCGPNVRLVYVTYRGGQKIVVARIIRPKIALQRLYASDSHFATLLKRARANHDPAPELH